MLYVKRGFSNGNHKPGFVEFTFGFKQEVGEYLTGSRTLRGDFWIGVTMRKDKIRFYGLESKNMEALEALCSKGFEVCHVAKLQKWAVYPNAAAVKDIGESDLVAGCLIPSAKLPFLNDDANKVFQYNCDNVKFGPGYVEFMIPPDLRAPHHGGRQNKYKPHDRLSKAEKVLEAAGIPFERTIRVKSHKPVIVVEGE